MSTEVLITSEQMPHQGTYSEHAPCLDESMPNPFSTRLDGDWDLVVLNEGTCTYRAGQRFSGMAFNQKPNVIEASNFPEALAVSERPGAVLLLPHLATPHVAQMNADSRRISLQNFIFRYSNPPLYLANREPLFTGVCAAIIHLDHLAVPEDNITAWDYVDNTQAAAEACYEGESDLCFTNENGLVKYDLNPIRELTRMQPTWYPYAWRALED